MSSPTDPALWDQRFSAADYVYGTEPNDFLFEQAAGIPPGRVLCLAEGEGRNAVFLARRGHPVTAVDFSREAQRKATALAAHHGVTLAYQLADLGDYEPEPEAFSAVVSIFCHLPPAVRRTVHARAARALAPGGLLILEAYSPAQLSRATGGPKDPTLLVPKDALVAELAETACLELVIARELVRDIHEGSLHGGESAVTQVVARRPARESSTENAP
ncbi:MAG TPA: methyltransferase domain-containing protein [Kofleriaceae bacterium]|nr:methyltransferase domain-containing protein [Kofleriaceae bacterium]